MPPRRIVSLVPSLTELVFWLGRGDHLVGRTRFCVEPAGLVEAVAIVGGTKNPRIDRILALTPDLVLANREENRREDVEALRTAGLQVLVTDPNTVLEAVAMVEHLGDLLDAQELAAELAADTRSAIAESIQSKIQNQKSKIFVPIWWNPLMGLGSATYGHDLLTVAGADNVLAGRDRYPALSLDEVRDLAPRLVLLPHEPFPFTDEHAAAFRPFAATRLIDGKLLWWYGPRMPAAIRTLHSLVAEARRRV